MQKVEQRAEKAAVIADEVLSKLLREYKSGDLNVTAGEWALAVATFAAAILTSTDPADFA